MENAFPLQHRILNWMHKSRDTMKHDRTDVDFGKRHVKPLSDKTFLAQTSSHFENLLMPSNAPDFFKMLCVSSLPLSTVSWHVEILNEFIFGSKVTVECSQELAVSVTTTILQQF